MSEVVFSERNFFVLIEETSKNSLLCVGLDSDFEKLPKSVVVRAQNYIERHVETYGNEKQQMIIEEAIFLLDLLRNKFIPSQNYRFLLSD